MAKPNDSIWRARNERLHFPDDVQRRLETGFDEAYELAHKKGRKALPAPHPSERAGFLRAIARSAESGSRLQEIRERTSEKERARRMESLALAAQKAFQMLRETDDDAMTLLSVLGMRRFFGKKAEDPTPTADYLPLAREARSMLAINLRQLSRLASRAAKELPARRSNPAMTVALGVEQAFFANGFRFTSSIDGFELQCLEAAFDLAGIDRATLEHYVKKVRKSEQSMTGLVRRLRENARQKRGGNSPPI